MPIDPSIALGYRGIEVPNQLAQFGQVAQIQNAQQANQLNEMKMAEYERARREEEGIRNYLAGTPSATSPEARAGLLKFGKTGLEYGKLLNEADKAAVDLGKTKAEATIKQTDVFRNLLGSVQTPAQAAQWVQAQYADPILGPVVKQVPMEQAIAGIPSDPKAFADWKNQNAIGMTEWAKRNTMTAAEKAVDARARERLAAETAASELSPQTIDFVAETYRQTGQLPPLGMGKAAVNMRQKVLDRAAQLAMGTGGTAKPAAEAAADVKAAKADTAAQASAIKDFSSGVSARRVTANNTAINHLGTMEKLADDLANNDTRVFNAAANAIGKQLGTAAPTNFDAARQLVASEVIKAVVANGGGVTERQEAAEQFARANSPAQLKGVINTYKELLGGQLASLGQQYETGTGRKDFDKKLSPDTRKILEKAAPAGGLSAAEQAELEQLRARFKK